ncbi:MAG TPA: CcmD family protein [Candidatus Didemnitutus sp.]|nr:CcmD family protein [Candidatus Didemnitutus sp.]
MINFMTNNATYVVLATALILWAGIAVYLQRVDARLRELEQRIER